MSARKKLNGLYVTGTAVLAAFVGSAYNSWWVFAVALAVLLVLNTMVGNIRPAYRR